MTLLSLTNDIPSIPYSKLSLDRPTERVSVAAFGALYRFVIVNATLWWWEKKGYTVPQVFTRVAKRHHEKVAFYYEKQKWTFAQIDELSNQVGHYFKSQGFKRNDSVALFVEGRPEYVCLWLGLAKIGVVAALINTNLRKNPLIHSITVANSKAIIFSDELAEGVEEVLDSLEGILMYQFSDANPPKLLPKAVNLSSAISRTQASSLSEDIGIAVPKDKLVYIFTSGTTGMPKAAVITNLRFMFMVVGVHWMLDVEFDDIIYDPLPLYHTAGGMIGVGQVLLHGSSVVIRKKFSASNFWTDCIAYKCTIAQYIGEICRYVLSTPEKPEDKQHKVRLIFGNGLRPQIWDKFVERFQVPRVGEFYGATEGISNLVNIDSTVGAVGFVPRYASFAYPVVLVKVDEATEEPIRDANGYCIKCQPDEIGMFLGKINPNKAICSFTGYADKSASEKKILHDVFKKGDQYFNSGDVLVMDELGYFFFKDRTGDTFRWRGENVATSEVEAIISNIVGLKDAVVYGVEIPNIEGKAGMAAIVDEEGTLNISSLADGLRKQLPPYARPLFLRVLATLPITGTYKLKKRELQLDGYDPVTIKDKLYYMDSRGQYVPLTKQAYEDILSNKIRL
uniref:Very long-chain fatty acid transport protein n=2 Tax=Timema TaxID=61471 RepID=A0A7R9PPU6_TIMGE|nr:unnamed protein product [Timema genevievae]